MCYIATTTTPKTALPLMLIARENYLKKDTLGHVFKYANNHNNTTNS